MTSTTERPPRTLPTPPIRTPESTTTTANRPGVAAPAVRPPRGASTTTGPSRPTPSPANPPPQGSPATTVGAVITGTDQTPATRRGDHIGPAARR
ncbi:hypothetical protein SAMN05421541_1114 [Actinoplanes philippinensis]|uniref:Uncharacterized protein n=1 Tax=Actinoplanes philippinensis TaxID=35752 RepID=A0A1I2J116_9ACTN|nr:hypothetical protein SAMN05421541_1114 [Actinoplanes philippinensis]